MASDLHIRYISRDFFFRHVSWVPWSSIDRLPFPWQPVGQNTRQMHATGGFVVALMCQPAFSYDLLPSRRNNKFVCLLGLLSARVLDWLAGYLLLHYELCVWHGRDGMRWDKRIGWKAGLYIMQRKRSTFVLGRISASTFIIILGMDNVNEKELEIFKQDLFVSLVVIMPEFRHVGQAIPLFSLT